MKKWVKIDKSAPTARADFMVAWLNKLLDPSTKQTKSVLEDKKGMCCLGVGCNVAKIKKKFYNDQDCYYFGSEKYDTHLPGSMTEFLNCSDNGEFIEGKEFLLFINQEV